MDKFEEYDVEDEDSEDYAPDSEFCPICDCEGELMGTLGNKKWFRCTGCGMDFATSV